MTLNQLMGLKAWHVRHGQTHPMERLAWEAVMTLWLLGWTGLPATLLAGTAVSLMHTLPSALPLLCLLLMALPRGYVGWRKRLHRRGQLRCDWLVLLR